MSDSLSSAYPVLAQRLQKSSFAELPTPVSSHNIDTSTGKRTVFVKHDDRTNSVYGGNKVRKLEYLLHRAEERGAKRVATFGAVGSNHALATAIFAAQSNLGCTCFLAHQKPTPNIPRTLDTHLELGTEVVRYGGSVNRLQTFRRYIQGRRTWVIPLGGTCWLGAVGFVNAGLELAEQIRAGVMPLPSRIYIANGTMGSAAGLGLGLALAELPTELHAIRVADNRYTRPETLQALAEKTAMLLSRLDASIPTDLAKRTRVVWRDEFFAGGYAAVDRDTTNAVRSAAENFGITLETTYTGKAMAALLHDLPLHDHADSDPCFLFWNTYNSRPLPATGDTPVDRSQLPAEFLRYFA